MFWSSLGSLKKFLFQCSLLFRQNVLIAVSNPSNGLLQPPHSSIYPSTDPPRKMVFENQARPFYASNYHFHNYLLLFITNCLKKLYWHWYRAPNQERPTHNIRSLGNFWKIASLRRGPLKSPVREGSPKWPVRERDPQNDQLGKWTPKITN